MKMTMWLAMVIFITATGESAFAEDAAPAKDSLKEIEEGPYVQSAQSGIVLSGYVDAGYLYNFQGGTLSRPLDVDNAPRGDFSLNQMKIALEKPLTDENTLQAGFRTDLIFGEDAGTFGGNAAGSDSLWVQQAYVQFKVPWGNGVVFQVGKFGAVLGYEADERVDNINITAGYLAALDPGKMTGLSADYPVNDILSVGAVVTNGSNADAGQIIDGTNDAISYSPYINLHNLAGNAETQLAVYHSPRGDLGMPGATENEPLVSINWWGTWKPQFAKDRLMLGANTTFLTILDASSTAAANPPLGSDDSSTSWGLALYQQYSFNDWFSLASRGEYVHNDDNQIFGFAGGTRRIDVWSWTGTAGFHLASDLMVRAEYRVDWGNQISVDDYDGPAHTFATQVVYSF